MRWIRIAMVLAVACIATVALVASGSTGSSGSGGTGGSSSPPTTTQADVVSGAQQVTVSQLVNDPSQYNGSDVTFQGTIVNFLQDSSGNTGAMNVADPNDGTSVVYIDLTQGSADVSQMSKGDSITIWGVGAGTTSTKNAFGGSINVSVITEAQLDDTTSNYTDKSAS